MEGTILGAAGLLFPSLWSTNDLFFEGKKILFGPRCSCSAPKREGQQTAAKPFALEHLFKKKRKKKTPSNFIKVAILFHNYLQKLIVIDEIPW